MAFCMGVLFRFLLPAATVLMFLGLGYPAMQDATAASALSGFAAKLNSIAPPMRQSFAYDQGKEMSRHQQLANNTVVKDLLL